MSYMPELEVTFDPFNDGDKLSQQWTAHRGLGEAATLTELAFDRPMPTANPDIVDGIEVHFVSPNYFMSGAPVKKIYPNTNGVRVQLAVPAAA